MDSISNLFQVGGLASGLDSKGLIDKLIAIESRPVDAMRTRRTRAQNQMSAYRDINGRMASLQARAADLLAPAALRGRAVTASAPAIATATADPSAMFATYRLDVTQLATATVATSRAAGTGGALGATVADDSVPLAQLNLATPITAGTFSLVVNGAKKTATVATDNSLADVFAAISAATGGAVTAALSGNRLVLTGDASVATLTAGAGSDTSNFLTATRLATAVYGGPGGELASTGNLGVTQLYATLGGNGAALATPLADTAAGSFLINGVTIAYDTGADALKDVISRINSANTGVTAAYDPVDDKLALTARTTGSTAIALEDVNGNFLAATGLLAADAQALGKNARFTVNGGPMQASMGNSVAGVLPGLTFQLLAQGQSDVTVGQDLDKAAAAARSFVDQFNSAIDLIDSSIGIDPDRPKVLGGDVTLASLRDNLYRLLSSPADGVAGSPSTLAALGISTGAIGSAPGTTKHLVLDEAKLRAAFQAAPEQAADVLAAADGTVSRGVIAKVNDYLKGINSASGVFTVSADAFTRQMRDLDDAIARSQRHLDQERSRLVQKFTALERSVAQIQSQQSAMLAQLVRLS